MIDFSYRCCTTKTRFDISRMRYISCDSDPYSLKLCCTSKTTYKVNKRVKVRLSLLKKWTRINHGLGLFALSDSRHTTASA